MASPIYDADQKKATENGLISTQSVLEDIKNLAKALVDTVAALAKDNVVPTVSQRDRVSNYKSRLIVWQRLTEKRADYRTLTFKTSDKKAPQLQVDHIVSYAAWTQFVKDRVADGTLTVDKAIDLFMPGIADPEKAAMKGYLGEDDEKLVAMAQSFINSIGNCSILNQTYNKFKDKNELGEIMDQMREFQVAPGAAAAEVDRNSWCAEMRLNDVLIHPFTGGYTIDDIVGAIVSRGNDVRNDLIQFVDAVPTHAVIH